MQTAQQPIILTRAMCKCGQIGTMYDKRKGLFVCWTCVAKSLQTTLQSNSFKKDR